jgi:hypothetical protein
MLIWKQLRQKIVTSLVKLNLKMVFIGKWKWTVDKILFLEIFRWQSFQMEVAETACWGLATVVNIFGLENIR